MKTTEPILIVDSHHGQYIPQIFVQQSSKEILDQISKEIKNDLLAGPDSEYYWDSMDSLINQTFTIEGQEFYLMYNEDLFLVPVDFETEDWII